VPDDDVTDATIKVLTPLIKGLFLMPGYSPGPETNQDYILEAANVLLADLDHPLSWPHDAPLSEVAAKLEIDGPGDPDKREVFQLLTSQLSRQPKTSYRF
jgi:hypothetical protein